VAPDWVASVKNIGVAKNRFLAVTSTACVAVHEASQAH